MYNHVKIEKKWRKYWDDHGIFKTDIYDFSKPKFYALDMFPYPSGVGLHVGHPEGYTATDVVCRMKKMQGYNVLHPIGFDSFGLPAEQYAINTGNHPAIFTNKNIKTFTEQLKLLSLSYDWDRTVSTSDPNFYKWTQWIFIQLYENGYAKKKKMSVNWCEDLGTVLANDEVIDGKSERGGFPVVRKQMEQWIIDMPAFAEKLLSGLEKLDWPESTKEIQKNWIGKSEGLEVDFMLSCGEKVSIFTTCPETLCGVMFLALSPESEILEELKPFIKNWAEVETYQSEYLKRTGVLKNGMDDKTGVKIEGITGRNPINRKKIELFVADYVLNDYGTGIVMGVPAHDQRDFEFAKKFQIPIVPVIKNNNKNRQEAVYSKKDYLSCRDSRMINSGDFNDLTVQNGKKKITNYLIKHGMGRTKINYKIREWIFARQRYWGEPIPIVYMQDGAELALKENDLPLVLPEMDDYKGRDGKSPLENAKAWKNVTINGKMGTRETATMPGSAGSSWYFLRYIDPKNNKEFANKKLLDHWMPVDLYVGGPEHAVGHLLYARMWNRFLYDRGLVPTEEPFTKLVHQGMILGSNGVKMGKRFPKFVVNPNDVIAEYGADTLRLYEMFMGPLEADKPWNDDAVKGVRRFLEKIHRLYTEERFLGKDNNKLESLYHFTIKKVTDDFEAMRFNTAISQLMIFVNAVQKENIFPLEYKEGFLKLLNPLAPHLTEELWSKMGHKECLAESEWPVYNIEKIATSKVDVAIAINGKTRTIIEVDKDASEDIVKRIALKDEKIVRNIGDQKIKKTFFVKNRMFNILLDSKK